MHTVLVESGLWASVLDVRIIQDPLSQITLIINFTFNDHCAMQFLLIVFDLGDRSQTTFTRGGGVGSPNMLIFVNVHKVENVSGGR